MHTRTHSRSVYEPWVKIEAPSKNDSHSKKRTSFAVHIMEVESERKKMVSVFGLHEMFPLQSGFVAAIKQSAA